MQIKLSTTEVKQAVILWLANTQGLVVAPEQLQEHYRTEGQYDEQAMYFDGLTIEVDSLKSGA